MITPEVADGICRIQGGFHIFFEYFSNMIQWNPSDIQVLHDAFWIVTDFEF